MQLSTIYIIEFCKQTKRNSYFNRLHIKQKVFYLNSLELSVKFKVENLIETKQILDSQDYYLNKCAAYLRRCRVFRYFRWAQPWGVIWIGACQNVQFNGTSIGHWNDLRTISTQLKILYHEIIRFSHFFHWTFCLCSTLLDKKQCQFLP